MFYLSRENNQTKENLYSNLFFSLENVLPQLFGFLYLLCKLLGHGTSHDCSFCSKKLNLICW